MPSLTIENATVEFRVPRAPRSLAGTLLRRTGGDYDQSRGVITALSGVNLQIKDGDRVGLIGHNGAGKSTLLRVMAGIYVPQYGAATIDGSVSALFQASPGMEPDDTGYRNIINCGLYLGMSPAEIRSKIADIAEFTELGDYLDLPVRIYSAGMLMRLSFAITTSIEPEILLIDEGLGTGDARFANKAKQRTTNLAGKSSILVLASHSPSLLATMCNRGIFMEKGKIVADGPIDEVIAAYNDSVVVGAAADDEVAQARAIQIAQDRVAAGEHVPLNMEEQALRAALRAVPGDALMLRRLCEVLIAQDKPVPPELEMEALAALIQSNPDNTTMIERLAVLRAQHSN